MKVETQLECKRNHKYRYPQPSMESLAMVAELLRHAIRIGVSRRQLTVDMKCHPKHDEGRSALLSGHFYPHDEKGRTISALIDRYSEIATPNNMAPSCQFSTPGIGVRDIWLAWNALNPGDDVAPTHTDRVIVGVAIDLIESGIEHRELTRAEIARWLGIPRGEFDRACAGIGEQMSYRYRAQELVRKANELKREGSL